MYRTVVVVRSRCVVSVSVPKKDRAAPSMERSGRPDPVEDQVNTITRYRTTRTVAGNERSQRGIRRGRGDVP